MQAREIEEIRAAKKKLLGVMNSLKETVYPGMTEADKIDYYTLRGVVDSLEVMIAQAGEANMRSYYGD